MRNFFLFFILFLLFTTPCLSQQKIKFSLSNPQQPDSCKNKKFPWGVLLVGGALEPDKSLYINNKGIFNISGISFNTVDGFYYGTGVELRKQLTAASRISFEPFVSYAFSRKNFDWHLISTYHYAQDTYIVKGEIGNKSSEFNTVGGPSELNNSLFSLFLRENYARKYMHEYMRLTNEIKIFSNLKLIASASYSRNMPLENNSDYSFWFRNKKEFSPNIPDNEFYKMQNHEDLYAELSLSYTPVLHTTYYKNGEKHREKIPEMPVFTISWRKAFARDKSFTDYDLLRFEVLQQKKLGESRFFNYKLNVGWFTQARNIFFNEFYHFDVRSKTIQSNDFFPAFKIMDYYSHSTDKYFGEAHFQYVAPKLLIKYFPFLHRRAWREQISVGYLYVPHDKNYSEVGYGIGNRIWNIGVFTAFKNFKYKNIGIGATLTIF